MIVDLPLAPLSVLAFIGTVLLTVVFTTMAIVTRARGRTALSGLLTKLLAGGIGLYIVILLGVSAFSKDYVLGRGAEKHFCELDCHIAYSVTKVETVRSVPADFSPQKLVDGGQLYLVTLRTRFDETTIGPQRGDGTLTPNPREIYVRDDGGKRYHPELALAGAPLDQPLRPGESYDTRILFSLPADAKNPRL